MARAVLAKVWVAGSQPKPAGFMPTLTSCAWTMSPGTRNPSSGMSPSQASTPPATSTPAIFGPMM